MPLARAFTPTLVASAIFAPFLRAGCRAGRRCLLQFGLGRLDDRELLLRRLGDEAVAAVESEVEETEEDRSDRRDDRPLRRRRVEEPGRHREDGEDEGDAR